MNLYKMHDKPEILYNYNIASNNIPLLFYAKLYDANDITGLKSKEHLIAKDPAHAYMYARDIINDIWPKGEAAIATDSGYSYMYADNILNSPFPAGEAAIAKSPTYAWNYVKNVLKGPFQAGEAIIMKSGYRDEYIELIEGEI